MIHIIYQAIEKSYYYCCLLRLVIQAKGFIFVGTVKADRVKISILTIRGLVQGVGFRPFIYRIACEMGIEGEVSNRNNGVSIRAVLSPEQRDHFIARIREEHPPVAYIHNIQWEEIEETEGNDMFHVPYAFAIVPSHSESEEVTQVAPDIAV